MGTSEAYFGHYRYGRERPLRFSAGGPFGSVYDAVLGADVAETLEYRLGEEIVIAHGTGELSLLDHGDKPFTVAGVLAKTGTPVDRSVYVSLEGIEAMHIDWSGGVPIPSQRVTAADALELDLTPRAITAFLVGVRSKTGIFQLQRDVNDYRREPLLAVLPGVALQELWNLLGAAERALLIVSGFVVLSGARRYAQFDPLEPQRTSAGDGYFALGRGAPLADFCSTYRRSRLLYGNRLRPRRRAAVRRPGRLTALDRAGVWPLFGGHPPQPLRPHPARAHRRRGRTHRIDPRLPRLPQLAG